MAQNQYKDDMLKLRVEMQTETLSERIREADNRLAQGADRLQLQSEAADMKLRLAQMAQQGMNDRSQAQLQGQLDKLLVKLGVAPTGDKAKDEAAGAAAVTDKAAAGTDTAKSDLDYWTGERKTTQTEIDKILTKYNGAQPPSGSMDLQNYQALQRRRDKAVESMSKAQKALEKAKASAPANPSGAPANAQHAGSQADPAEPATQADYDALPSGAYFKDDEGVKKKP
jgi:hypothetical protein